MGEFVRRCAGVFVASWLCACGDNVGTGDPVPTEGSDRDDARASSDAGAEVTVDTGGRPGNDGRDRDAAPESGPTDSGTTDTGSPPADSGAPTTDATSVDAIVVDAISVDAVPSDAGPGG